MSLLRPALAAGGPAAPVSVSGGNLTWVVIVAVIALAALAVAGVLAHHYGWKAAVPAYIGAAYIATARVHDNKHYLSDVTFGAGVVARGAVEVVAPEGETLRIPDGAVLIGVVSKP